MCFKDQITVCIYVDYLLITSVDEYELAATGLDLNNI